MDILHFCWRPHGNFDFCGFFVGYQVKYQNNSNSNSAKIPTQLNQVQIYSQRYR